ncbi:MAG: hypothetical protein HFJ54_07870 [Clostridia bacterium]|nr:hypothetical protein [Clostridia bacterium]
MKKNSDNSWIIVLIFLFVLSLASGRTDETENKATSTPEQTAKDEQVTQSAENVNNVLGAVPYSEEWFFNILNSVEIGNHSNIDVHLEQDGEKLLSIDMNSKKSVSSVATAVYQKMVDNNTKTLLLRVIGTGISDTPIGQVCKLRFTIPAQVSNYQEDELNSNYSQGAYSAKWFFDVLSGVEIGSHSNIDVCLKDSAKEEILLVKMNMDESVPGVAALVYQKSIEYGEEDVLLDVIGSGISDTPLGSVYKLQLTIPKR